MIDLLLLLAFVVTGVIVGVLWCYLWSDERWYNRHYYLDWRNMTKHRQRYERATGQGEVE